MLSGFDAHSPTNAADHKKLGIEMLTRGQYDQALYSFKTALDLEAKELGDRHPTVAATKVNIGVIFQSQGNYIDALKVYDEVIAVLEKDSSRKASMGVLYLNRGACYLSLEDRQNALASYSNAIRIKQEVHGDAHVEVMCP